jgi:adenosylmethionine-8-amino-7-oxononanoate aminotransferase
VIQVVGDTIVLAPALIASEDEIAVIVSKLAAIFEHLR